MTSLPPVICAYQKVSVISSGRRRSLFNHPVCSLEPSDTTTYFSLLEFALDLLHDPHVTRCMLPETENFQLDMNIQHTLPMRSDSQSAFWLKIATPP